MEYFIDGYNLLHFFNDEIHDIHKQRNEMIESLDHALDLSEFVTMSFVFDGTYSEEKDVTYGYHGQFILLFTPQNVTADSYLESELIHKKNPSLITVVTSDKKLARFCREKGAKTQSCKQFMKWVKNKSQKGDKQKPEKETKTDSDRLYKAFMKKFNERS